jgi:hypothetical protein
MTGLLLTDVPHCDRHLISMSTMQVSSASTSFEAFVCPRCSRAFREERGYHDITEWGISVDIADSPVCYSDGDYLYLVEDAVNRHSGTLSNPKHAGGEAIKGPTPLRAPVIQAHLAA